MKRSLLLFSLLICRHAFAEEPEPFSARVEPPRQEDVLILAQQAPPPAPGIPGRPAVPVSPPGPGAPGGFVPPPNDFGRSSAPGVPGAVGAGTFNTRMAGVVQRPPDAGPIMNFEEPAKRTVLIGFDKADQETRQNIQEDMQIMSRILDKASERALENNTQDRRMGIAVMALPGARGENIYLEDYGPVFILNVPIPLSGSDKSTSAKDENDDSDWEQTKRELYQNRTFSPFAPMKFDPKKVEALKRELLDALKNAKNIRQLKSDQVITVAVTGSGASSYSGFTKKMAHKRDGEPDKEEVHRDVMEKKVPPPQSSTLTIRVKKSDVEAFASGKMNSEEFAKKARISMQ